MTTKTNETVSAAFRAAFESHPARETDPSLALTSARETAAELIPAGVSGSFDDEALTFSADQDRALIVITTRTDLVTYLHDSRPDLTDMGQEYVDAVCDQTQHSDHPAWGSDWSAWLDEEMGRLIEATVAGIDALKPSDAERYYLTNEIAVDATTEQNLLDNGNSGDAKVSLRCARGIGSHAGEWLYYLHTNADPVLLTDDPDLARDWINTLGCPEWQIIEAIDGSNHGASSEWAIDQINHATVD